MPSFVAPRRWRPSARFLFRALVSEALSDKLRAQGDRDSKPWMKTFDKLRHLHQETDRMNRIIGRSSSIRSRLRINRDPGQTALAFAEKRRSFGSRSDRHSRAAF